MRLPAGSEAPEGAFNKIQEAERLHVSNIIRPYHGAGGAGYVRNICPYLLGKCPEGSAEGAHPSERFPYQYRKRLWSSIQLRGSGPA